MTQVIVIVVGAEHEMMREDAVLDELCRSGSCSPPFEYAAPSLDQTALVAVEAPSMDQALEANYDATKEEETLTCDSVDPLVRIERSVAQMVDAHGWLGNLQQNSVTHGTGFGGRRARKHKKKIVHFEEQFEEDEEEKSNEEPRSQFSWAGPVFDFLLCWLAIGTTMMTGQTFARLVSPCGEFVVWAPQLFGVGLPPKFEHDQISSDYRAAFEQLPELDDEGKEVAILEYALEQYSDMDFNEDGIIVMSEYLRVEGASAHDFEEFMGYADSNSDGKLSTWEAYYLSFEDLDQSGLVEGEAVD